MRSAYTRVLAWAHVLLAVSWLLPLHGFPSPGRVNVIQAIAGSAPTWAIGFGLTGALLLVSCGRPRLARFGHGCGVVVLTGFGAASASGAALSVPIGAFWPALFAFTLSAVHLVTQRAYLRVVT
jgi:hypothetical protein